MTIVNPGPWVNPEVIESEPWKTQTGPIKFIEFPVRNPAMSRRAFQLYWQKHHSPHVMNLTAFSQFIRKYSSGHIYPEPITGVPEHYAQTTPYEGASELWLDSIGEIGKWFDQPVYEERIHPDEQRFLSQGGEAAFILAKEERLYDPDPDEPESLKTKVYVLVRQQPGQDRDAFHCAVSQHGQLILEQRGLREHLEKLVINHKLCEPHPQGMELSDIGSILELWFKDLATARKFFAREEYLTQILPNEHACFDINTIQVLVTKMRVIHDEYSFQPTTTQPMSFHWND
jgi:hypothetical protein